MKELSKFLNGLRGGAIHDERESLLELKKHSLLSLHNLYHTWLITKREDLEKYKNSSRLSRISPAGERYASVSANGEVLKYIMLDNRINV
jgi:hypothetical protein